MDMMLGQSFQRTISQVGMVETSLISRTLENKKPGVVSSVYLLYIIKQWIEELPLKISRLSIVL